MAHAANPSAQRNAAAVGEPHPAQAAPLPSQPLIAESSLWLGPLQIGR